MCVGHNRNVLFTIEMCCLQQESVLHNRNVFFTIGMCGLQQKCVVHNNNVFFKIEMCCQKCVVYERNVLFTTEMCLQQKCVVYNQNMFSQQKRVFDHRNMSITLKMCCSKQRCLIYNGNKVFSIDACNQKCRRVQLEISTIGKRCSQQILLTNRRVQLENLLGATLSYRGIDACNQKCVFPRQESVAPNRFFFNNRRVLLTILACYTYESIMSHI